MKKEYYERKLTTALLLIAAGLIFMIAFTLLNKYFETKSESEKIFVTNVNPQEINGLFFENTDAIELFLNDGIWSCDNGELSVDQNIVDNLCHQVSEIPATRLLENADDYYRTFGFNNPIAQIRINTDLSETKLTVGNYNKGTGTYYVYKDGYSSNIYLVRSKYIDPFLIGKENLLPGIEEYFPDKSQIKKICIKTQNEEFCIVKSELANPLPYSENYSWAINRKDGKSLPAYDNRVASFISSIYCIGDCKRVGKYSNSIDNGTVISIAFADSLENHELTISFSQPNPDGSVNIFSDICKPIYEMDSDKYETFSRNFKSFYLTAKNICHFNLDELSGLSIEGASANLDVTIIPDKTGYYYQVGNKNIDKEAFDTLFDFIRNVSAEGYLPDEKIEMPEHIADTLIIKFRKNNDSSITLTLESFDANFYIASIGPINNALVSKTTVSQIKELADKTIS